VPLLLQVGAKGKVRDLGRGRGYDHVPAAIAPLLAIPPAQEEAEEAGASDSFKRTAWYRRCAPQAVTSPASLPRRILTYVTYADAWGRMCGRWAAEEYMRNVSAARDAAGLPSFLDIITKPGWDKQVGDVWELDEQGNLLPPEAPEFLTLSPAPPPPRAHHPHTQRFDDDDDDDDDDDEEEEEEGGCGAKRQLVKRGKRASEVGDTEASSDGGRLWGEEEVEAVRERLEDADAEDDDEATLQALRMPLRTYAITHTITCQ
jgi:hypothetical protein